MVPATAAGGVIAGPAGALPPSVAVRGVEFIAINTDAQDLDCCNARRKIYIGKNLTRGLGTGMNPEIGRQAAEENRSEIVEALRGADLVFITAGLGGGTGSGASPVIAEAARELGALTVSVVTKPFSFEGVQRARIADEASLKLKEKSDTLIIVPNDRIFSIIQDDTPLLKAFEYIDEVLRQSVQGIAELIAMPGIINVDFADVRAIMADAGSALVGIGVASGGERAKNAVLQAIQSPLLEISIEGARGVLFAISGGRDVKMTEVNEIAKTIGVAIDPGAKIIFGAYQDRKLDKGQIKVVMIATGFNGALGKNETSTSNLFSSYDAVSSPVTPAIKSERIEPAGLSIKDEVQLADKNGKEKEKEKYKDKKEGSKKKSDDIWDIPAFLRKRKK